MSVISLHEEQVSTNLSCPSQAGPEWPQTIKGSFIGTELLSQKGPAKTSPFLLLHRMTFGALTFLSLFLKADLQHIKKDTCFMVSHTQI